MTRPMSRAKRKAAFLEQADEMFEELEAWYDQHPDANFEEIEAQARSARRKMMGNALQIMVNGRTVGKRAKAPHCGQCDEPMSLQDYRSKTIYGIEGDPELERAYYVCDKCEGQTFFPPR